MSNAKAVASAHGAVFHSPRSEVHDLKRRRKKLAIVFLSVLAGAVILGLGVYQSIAVPRVALLGTDIDKSADTTIYVKGVQDYLNHHILQRSRLTLDINGLTAYLQQNGFPEVEGVSDNLVYDGLGVTKISLTLRRPVVSWQTGSKTLYVDSDGASFERSYYSGAVVRVIDETGIKATDGKVLVSDRFLQFIGKAVGHFSRQGLNVNKVVLPPDTSRQIWVSLDGFSYAVKMTIDRPVGGQVEDAVRSVKYMSKQGIVPTQYVDVRVSGKAFFK